MFRKLETEEYPEEKRPTQPRYHGRHQLNRHPDGLEKCVGCELCAWACPADAILVEGASNDDSEGGLGRFSPGERYGRVYQINYLRCIFCGLCIEACPTRALTMTNFYELADNNRGDLIFTKEQLLAPLLGGHAPRAAPDGRRPRGARLLPGQGRPGDARAGGLGEGARRRAAGRGRRERRPGRGCRHRAHRPGHARHAAERRCADDRHGRAGALLDPRTPVRAWGPSGLDLRQEGGPRRARHGPGHDQPRHLLHRAGGGLPRHHPDLRLHRRRDDALPLRPHARRCRLLRLARGDAQGSEVGLARAGPRPRRPRVLRRRPRCSSAR